MDYIINNNSTKNSGFSGGWLHRRSRYWRMWVKSITLLVSTSFIFPYMAFAFQASTYPAGAGKLSPAISFLANGAPVEVAADLGRVVSSFHGKSGKAVVYINDLHCNYEVQSNIAGLLGSLAKKNGLKLVGVEGESRPVNVSELSTVPRASVKNNVGQYFLKRGRITGPEYLAATGNQALMLEGIEDQALYDQNKGTLLKFLNEEAQGYCEDLKSVVEKLKAPLYSTDLAKLDHFREQFDGETITLETYCRFLLDQGAKQGISLANFPRLNLFAQEGRVPAAADSDYDKLVGDAEDLDRAVRERLYTSQDQRLLDHYAAVLKIMAGMLTISATAKELEYYRAHRDEFAVTTLVGFLDKLCFRGGVSSNLDTGVVKLDEYLKLAGQFYEVADKRSDAFVQNTLSQMDRHRQNLAVLITGGFHNPLVEAAFKKRGVSFLTVKPRITHTYDENPYFSLLRNRRAPMEELLAQNQKIFAPPSAFNDLGFIQYLKSVVGIDLVRELMDKSHDSAEFQAAYLSALQQDRRGGARDMFDIGRMQSNLQKKIYALPVKGSAYSVVLRPSAAMTDNSATLPFVKAREDLGNGYEFQIVETAALEANRSQILDIAQTGRARALWPSVSAVLANVWQSLKGSLSSWQVQAAGGTVLAVAMLAGLATTAPAAAVVAAEVLLVAGVMLLGYFLFTNTKTPAWLKAGSAVALALVASTLSQHAGPWLVQFSQSLSQALSPTVDAGHAGNLAVKGAFMLPLVGLAGSLKGVLKGLGASVMPGDNLIDRAIVFSQQTFGFGKPEFEGTTFRTSVEDLVARLKELSADEATAPGVRAVLGKALTDAQLLALLAVVWHQTPLVSLNAEGEEPTAALSPEAKVLVFARDLAQGEELAGLLREGKPAPAELLQNGNSYLAQLLKATAAPASAKEFPLGAGVDALHPERLLALTVMEDQAAALAKLAKSQGVKLSVQGPILSTVLGFHPEDAQLVSANEKATDVAHALGVSAVNVLADLTGGGRQQLAEYARAHQVQVAQAPQALAATGVVEAARQPAAAVQVAETAGAEIGLEELLAGFEIVENSGPAQALPEESSEREWRLDIPAPFMEIAKNFKTQLDKTPTAEGVLQLVAQLEIDMKKAKADHDLSDTDWTKAQALMDIDYLAPRNFRLVASERVPLGKDWHLILLKVDTQRTMVGSTDMGNVNNYVVDPVAPEDGEFIRFLGCSPTFSDDTLIVGSKMQSELEETRKLSALDKSRLKVEARAYHRLIRPMFVDRGTARKNAQAEEKRKENLLVQLVSHESEHKRQAREYRQVLKQSVVHFNMLDELGAESKSMLDTDPVLVVAHLLSSMDYSDPYPNQNVSCFDPGTGKYIQYKDQKVPYKSGDLTRYILGRLTQLNPDTQRQEIRDALEAMAKYPDEVQRQAKRLYQETQALRGIWIQAKKDVLALDAKVEAAEGAGALGSTAKTEIEGLWKQAQIALLDARFSEKTAEYIAQQVKAAEGLLAKVKPAAPVPNAAEAPAAAAEPVAAALATVEQVAKQGWAGLEAAATTGVWSTVVGAGAGLGNIAAPTVNLARTHTLPLYLWRPLKAKLQTALDKGDINQVTYDRLISGQGVMRVVGGRIVAESPLVIKLLAEVLTQETGRSVSARQVSDYLLFHESTHLAADRLTAGTLDQLVAALQSPARYAGTRVSGFAQLKQWFANNYGADYATGSDRAFVEELLVVLHTERAQLNQPVRLLQDTNNPKAGRVDLPASVATVLAKVAKQLPTVQPQGSREFSPAPNTLQRIAGAARNWLRAGGEALVLSLSLLVGICAVAAIGCEGGIPQVQISGKQAQIDQAVQSLNQQYKQMQSAMTDGERTLFKEVLDVLATSQVIYDPTVNYTHVDTDNRIISLSEEDFAGGAEAVRNAITHEALHIVYQKTLNLQLPETEQTAGFKTDSDYWNWIEPGQEGWVLQRTQSMIDLMHEFKLNTDGTITRLTKKVNPSPAVAGKILYSGNGVNLDVQGIITTAKDPSWVMERREYLVKWLALIALDKVQAIFPGDLVAPEDQQAARDALPLLRQYYQDKTIQLFDAIQKSDPSFTGSQDQIDQAFAAYHNNPDQMTPEQSNIKEWYESQEIAAKADLSVTMVAANTTAGSKIIQATHRPAAKTETYTDVETRGKTEGTLKPVESEPFRRLLQNHLQGLVDHLRPLLAPSLLPRVQSILQQIVDRQTGINLQTIGAIHGNIAVSQIAGNNFNAILEAGMSEPLRNSTFIHEAVESALEQAGLLREHRHLLAFIAEEAEFPGSIALKLADPEHYTMEQLKNLMADVDQEKLDIKAQTGLSPEIKKRQEDNADKVAAAASLELVRRQTAHIESVQMETLNIQKRLSYGMVSNVYVVDFKGKKAVLLMRKAFDPRAADHKANPTVKDIADTEEGVLKAVANYEAYNGLTYEGHNVGLETYAVVRNAQGHVVGYLGEFLEGQELGELASTGAISEQQLEEALAQLRGQLDVIHSKGLFHGDARPENIIVKVLADGHVIARFIDFWEENGNWSKAEDLQLFQERVVDVCRSAIQPEVVAATLEKRRILAEAQRNQQFLIANRKALEEAKTAVRRLQTALEDEAKFEKFAPLTRGMRDSLRVGTKESRLYALEDFKIMQGRLAAGLAEFVRQIGEAVPETAPVEIVQAKATCLAALQSLNENWTSFFQPAQAQGAAGANGSVAKKVIRATYRTRLDMPAGVEDYSRIEEQGRQEHTLKPRDAEKFRIMLGANLNGILKQLGKSVDKSVMPQVKTTLQAIANGQGAGINLRTINTIEDALAVSRFDGKVLNVILEEGTPADLEGPTFVHEAAEAVLDYYKVSKAHAITHVAEQAQFPKSLALMLQNMRKYSSAHLQELIDDTQAEIDVIRGQSEVNAYVSGQQEKNAEQLKAAALKILQARQPYFLLANDVLHEIGNPGSAQMKRLMRLGDVLIALAGHGGMAGLREKLNDSSSPEFQAFVDSVLKAGGPIAPKTNEDRYPIQNLGLQTFALPVIIRQKVENQDRTLRLGSLGTSTGVDLREIAKIVQTVLTEAGEDIGRWEIILDGMDMSQTSLETLQKTTLAGLPASFKVETHITVLGKIEDQQALAKRRFDVLLFRTTAAYLRSEVLEQVKRSINADVFLPDNDVRPDEGQYAQVFYGVYQNKQARIPQIKIDAQKSSRLPASAFTHIFREAVARFPHDPNYYQRQFTPLRLDALTPALADSAKAAPWLSPARWLGAVWGKIIAWNASRQTAKQKRNKPSTGGQAPQGAAGAKVDEAAIQKAAAPLAKGLQGKVGAALKLAGLDMNPAGQAVLQTGVLLARLDQAVAGLDAEHATLAKKTVKSGADQAALANYAQARAELEAVRTQLAKVKANSVFEILVSHDMDVKVPALVINGKLYLNSKHINRIAERGNLLQLARMLMHEVGHVAGIRGDREGEGRVGMLSRIAAGYQLGTADVMNEIRKVDERLVLEGPAAGTGAQPIRWAENVTADMREMIEFLAFKQKATLEAQLSKTLGKDVVINAIRSGELAGSGELKRVYQVVVDTNLGEMSVAINFIRSDFNEPGTTAVQAARQEVNYFQALADRLQRPWLARFIFTLAVWNDAIPPSQMTRLEGILAKNKLEAITFGLFVKGPTLDAIPLEQRVKVFRKGVATMGEAWMKYRKNGDSKKGLMNPDLKASNYAWDEGRQTVEFLDLDRAQFVGVNSFFSTLDDYVGNAELENDPRTLFYYTKELPARDKANREIIFGGLLDAWGQDEFFKNVFQYGASINKIKRKAAFYAGVRAFIQESQNPALARAARNYPELNGTSQANAVPVNLLGQKAANDNSAQGVASKVIRATHRPAVETENYKDVAMRGLANRSLHIVTAGNYPKLLRENLQGILDVLQPLLEPEQYSAAERIFNRLAQRQVSMSVMSIAGGIKGKIAVSQFSDMDRMLNIILAGTMKDLRDSTVIHEIVEPTLEKAGVDKNLRHLLAFIVEAELFPESIARKLTDHSLYTDEDLRNLRDDLEREKDAIRTRPGVRQAIKDKQIANADKLAAAAEKELANRGEPERTGLLQTFRAKAALAGVLFIGLVLAVISVLPATWQGNMTSWLPGQQRENAAQVQAAKAVDYHMLVDQAMAGYDAAYQGPFGEKAGIFTKAEFKQALVESIQGLLQKDPAFMRYFAAVDEIQFASLDPNTSAQFVNLNGKRVMKINHVAINPSAAGEGIGIAFFLQHRRPPTKIELGQLLRDELKRKISHEAAHAFQNVQGILTDDKLPEVSTLLAGSAKREPVKAELAGSIGVRGRMEAEAYLIGYHFSNDAFSQWMARHLADRGWKGEAFTGALASIYGDAYWDNRRADVYNGLMALDATISQSCEYVSLRPAVEAGKYVLNFRTPDGKLGEVEVMFNVPQQSVPKETILSVTTETPLKTQFVILRQISGAEIPLQALNVQGNITRLVDQAMAGYEQAFTAYPAAQAMFSKDQFRGLLIEGIEEFRKADPRLFAKYFKLVDKIRFDRKNGWGTPLVSAVIENYPTKSVMAVNPTFYNPSKASEGAGAGLVRDLGRAPTREELIVRIRSDFASRFAHEAVHGDQNLHGVIGGNQVPSISELFNANGNISRVPLASLPKLEGTGRKEYEAQAIISLLFKNSPDQRLYEVSNWVTRHTPDRNQAGQLFSGVVIQNWGTPVKGIIQRDISDGLSALDSQLLLTQGPASRYEFAELAPSAKPGVYELAYYLNGKPGKAEVAFNQAQGKVPGTALLSLDVPLGKFVVLRQISGAEIPLKAAAQPQAPGQPGSVTVDGHTYNIPAEAAGRKLLNYNTSHSLLGTHVSFVLEKTAADVAALLAARTEAIEKVRAKRDELSASGTDPEAVRILTSVLGGLEKLSPRDIQIHTAVSKDAAHPGEPLNSYTIGGVPYIPVSHLANPAILPASLSHELTHSAAGLGMDRESRVVALTALVFGPQIDVSIIEKPRGGFGLKVESLDPKLDMNSPQVKTAIANALRAAQAGMDKDTAEGRPVLKELQDFIGSEMLARGIVSPRAGLVKKLQPLALPGAVIGAAIAAVIGFFALSLPVVSAVAFGYLAWSLSKIVWILAKLIGKYKWSFWRNLAVPVGAYSPVLGKMVNPDRPLEPIYEGGFFDTAHERYAHTWAQAMVDGVLKFRGQSLADWETQATVAKMQGWRVPASYYFWNVVVSEVLAHVLDLVAMPLVMADGLFPKWKAEKLGTQISAVLLGIVWGVGLPTAAVLVAAGLLSISWGIGVAFAVVLGITAALRIWTERIGVPVIGLTEFEFNQQINEGTYSNVYKATYQGKPCVFIRQMLFNPHTEANIDLAATSLKDLNKIKTQISDAVGYYGRLKGISYQGHNLAPEVYAVVKDETGRIVGYLSEYVAGRDLYSWMQSGELDENDIREIQRQIKEQLDILHNHQPRFLHGDVSAGNIMVERNDDGTLTTRLIDFGILRAGFTVLEDNEGFQFTFENIDDFYLARRPKKLDQIRESRDTKAKRDFLDAQGANITSLQASFQRLNALLKRDRITHQQRFVRSLEEINSLWDPFKDITGRWFWTIKDFKAIFQRVLANTEKIEQIEAVLISRASTPVEIRDSASRFIWNYKKIQSEWGAFFNSLGMTVTPDANAEITPSAPEVTTGSGSPGRASKDIALTREQQTQEYAEVLLQGTGLQPLESRPFRELLRDPDTGVEAIMGILQELLGDSPDDLAKLPHVKDILNAVAFGEIALDLKTVDAIKNGIAVHHLSKKQLNIIMENKLPGNLPASTFVQEVVEAALDEADISAASDHAMAFIVETKLFPKSIDEKLSNPEHYNEAKLTNLASRDNLRTALNDVHNEFLKHQKIVDQKRTNAYKVQSAASKLLAERMQGGTGDEKIKLLSREDALQQLADVTWAMKNGEYQQQALVDLRNLPADKEVILVGDLHAREDNLFKILNSNNNMEKIRNGDAILVIVGDAEHREDKPTEMDSTLHIMQTIMALKIYAPNSVYYIEGNHDTFDEARNVKSGIDQGLAHRARMVQLYGEDFARHYENFRKSLAVMGIGQNFCTLHAGIPSGFGLHQIQGVEDVQNFNDPIIRAATYSRYDPLYDEANDYDPDRYNDELIRSFLKSMGLPEDAHLIVGHTPKRDGNWHWEPSRARNVHIIFAAHDRAGYASVKNGKYAEVEVTNTSEAPRTFTKNVPEGLTLGTTVKIGDAGELEDLFAIIHQILPEKTTLKDNPRTGADWIVALKSAGQRMEEMQARHPDTSLGLDELDKIAREFELYVSDQQSPFYGIWRVYQRVHKIRGTEEITLALALPATAAEVAVALGISLVALSVPLVSLAAGAYLVWSLSKFIWVLAALVRKHSWAFLAHLAEPVAAYSPVSRTMIFGSGFFAIAHERHAHFWAQSLVDRVLAPFGKSLAGYALLAGQARALGRPAPAGYYIWNAGISEFLAHLLDLLAMPLAVADGLFPDWQDQNLVIRFSAITAGLLFGAGIPVAAALGAVGVFSALSALASVAGIAGLAWALRWAFASPDVREATQAATDYFRAHPFQASLAVLNLVLTVLAIFVPALRPAAGSAMLGMVGATGINLEQTIPTFDTGRTNLKNFLGKGQPLVLAMAEIDSFEEMKQIYGLEIASFIHARALQELAVSLGKGVYLFRDDADTAGRFGIALKDPRRYAENIQAILREAQANLQWIFRRNYRIVTLQATGVPMPEARLDALRGLVGNSRYGLHAVSVTEGNAVQIAYDANKEAALQEFLETNRFLEQAQQLNSMRFNYAEQIGSGYGFLYAPQLNIGIASEEAWNKAMDRIPHARTRGSLRNFSGQLFRDLREAAQEARIKARAAKGGLEVADKLNESEDEAVPASRPSTPPPASRPSYFPKSGNPEPAVVMAVFKDRQDEIFRAWFEARADKLAADGNLDVLGRLDALRNLFEDYRGVLEDIFDYDALGVIFHRALAVVDSLPDAHRDRSTAIGKLQSITSAWEAQFGGQQQAKFRQEHQEFEPALAELERVIDRPAREHELTQFRQTVGKIINDHEMEVAQPGARVKLAFSTFMNFFRYWIRAFSAKPDFADRSAFPAIFTRDNINSIADDILGMMLKPESREDSEKLVNFLIWDLENLGYPIKIDAESGLKVGGKNVTITQAGSHFQIVPIDPNSYFDVKIKIAPCPKLPFGAEIQIPSDLFMKVATQPTYAVGKILLRSQNWVVAMSGGSATNKHEVAAMLADELGYKLVDVGLIYRAFAAAYDEAKGRTNLDIKKFAKAANISDMSRTRPGTDGKGGAVAITIAYGGRVFNYSFPDTIAREAVDAATTHNQTLQDRVNIQVRDQAMNGRVVVVGREPVTLFKTNLNLHFDTIEGVRTSRTSSAPEPANDALRISAQMQKHAGQTVRAILNEMSTKHLSGAARLNEPVVESKKGTQKGTRSRGAVQLELLAGMGAVGMLVFSVLLFQAAGLAAVAILWGAAAGVFGLVFGLAKAWDAWSSRTGNAAAQKESSAALAQGQNAVGTQTGILAPILQAANLGITPQQGPTFTDRVRAAVSNFRPADSVPASLNLFPGIFRITSQLTSVLRSGLLNVLWTGLLALPMGGAVWTAVLGFMGPALRAAVVEQAVVRVRSIGNAGEAQKVLAFVSALSAVPGVEFTPLALELPEGKRTLNIPNEIIFRPALLHRLLSPVLDENNILQLLQRFRRSMDDAA